MIHNWISGMLIPDVTIDDVLTVLLDYDKYPDISRRHPEQAAWRRRQFEQHLPTVAPRGYRAGHVARGRLSNARWKASRCLVQIHRDSGSPERGESNEELLPAGKDRGHMWRIYVSWRREQRQDGVFAECHSISLSRNIPFLLRWIVTPFVRRIPRQGLERSLEATRVVTRKVAEDSAAIAAPAVN